MYLNILRRLTIMLALSSAVPGLVAFADDASDTAKVADGILKDSTVCQSPSPTSSTDDKTSSGSSGASTSMTAGSEDAKKTNPIEAVPSDSKKSISSVVTKSSDKATNSAKQEASTLSEKLKKWVDQDDDLLAKSDKVNTLLLEKAQPINQIEKLAKDYTQRFGPSNPLVVSVYDKLAGRYFMSGRFSDSRAATNWLLIACQKHYPGLPSDYAATSKANLGAMDYLEGRYDQAETELKSALASMPTKNPTPKSQAAAIQKKIYRLIGKVYLKQNKIAEAQANLCKGSSNLKEYLASPNPDEFLKKSRLATEKNLNELSKMTTSQLLRPQ